MSLPAGGRMDFTLSPAQARARYYLDYVNPGNVDDDLGSPGVPEWPPVLNRTLAAQVLGVTLREISMLSGKGGPLTNHLVDGRVHWWLADLVAYQKQQEEVR